MASGIWTEQNKVLAGAYINIKSQGQLAQFNFGGQGRLGLYEPLPWGADVTVLTAEELIDGRSLSKIGLSLSSDADLVKNLLQAFKGAKEIVIVRADTGGSNASAISGETGNQLITTAKYAGVAGNNISVKVSSSGSNVLVQTYYNSTLVDEQSITNVSELVDNAFVTFSGEGAPPITELTPLTDGVNGTVQPITLTEINVFAGFHTDIIYLGEEWTEEVVGFVETARNAGDKVKLFVKVTEGPFNADSEATIGFFTNGLRGLKGEDVTDQVLYYVAGLMAGIPIGGSATYHVLDFVGSSADTFSDAEAIELIKEGLMFVRKRYNGDFVIEKDVNSLKTVSNEKSDIFKENKVIRILDTVHNFVRNTFEVKYISKPNNQSIREVFKGEIVRYMTALQDSQIITNFDSANDIIVYAGEGINSIRADVFIQPVGALEKLYMNIIVRG
jgi:hypothetical protein